MKNRVRILSDASLLVMLIVVTVLISAGMAYLLAIVSEPRNPPDPMTPFVQGMIIVMYVAYII